MLLGIANFAIHLAATSCVLRISLQKSTAPYIAVAISVSNMGIEEQRKQVEL